MLTTNLSDTPSTDLDVANEPSPDDVHLYIGDNLTAEETARVTSTVADGYADNTRLAYASRLTQYLSWLRDTGRVESSAFQPHIIAAYLSWMSSEGLAASTVEQSLAAILRTARSRGEDASNIRRAQVIADVMRGIRRSSRLNSSPRRAHAWSTDEIKRIVRHLNASDTTTAVRDLALYLVNISTGMRGAEVCALRWADISEVDRGIELTVFSSKTNVDPVDVPVGRLSASHTDKCPVARLLAWKQVQQEALAATDEQMLRLPVFTQIRRGGNIHRDPLSGPAVTSIYRRICDEAGVPTEGVSSHSARATMASRSLEYGTDVGALLAVGRWANPTMLLTVYDRRDVWERGSASDFLGAV